MGQLDGKVIIITGASRGIGRALALGFAKEGAIIVGAARTLKRATGSEPGSLVETVAEIEKLGGTALAVRADVTREPDAKRVADRAVRRFGRIDILVNNAGLISREDILKVDMKWWDQVFRVNVRGPVVMSRAVLPHMMERKQGHIINISSGAAYRVRPGELAYAGSKGAVERITLNMAEFGKPYGIAVNALRPDHLLTGMSSGVPRPAGYRGLEPPEVLLPAAVWLAKQTVTTFTGQSVGRLDFGKTWGI